MSEGLVKLLSFYVIFLTVLLLPVNAGAEVLQSENYQFDESSISTGDMIQSSSSSYQSTGATGDLVVGESASSNYQIDVGSQTTGDPYLSLKFVSSTADFGGFSATSASTSTASFSVANYTSYGYIVQITGNSPSNGSHTIDAMTTTGTSQVGTEQFGINLVANTSPTTFGANLDNDDFGFGQISANYSTPNEFRYVSGEIIAYAPKSSGETIYTISYLINVEPLTPGGNYTSGQTIIVTGTY